MNTQLVELLKVAEQRLASGWCQGKPRGPKGEVDLYRALEHSDEELSRAASTAIFHQLKGKYEYLSQWEDEKGRTQAEVIALVRMTRERLQREDRPSTETEEFRWYRVEPKA